MVGRGLAAILRRLAHQLYEFSSIRAIDADARLLARRRRPEWRPQSPLSNRRPALGTTGAEVGVLSLRPASPHRTCSRAECVRVSVEGANRLQRAESHEIRSRCSFDFSPGLTFQVLTIESQPPIFGTPCGWLKCGPRYRAGRSAAIPMGSLRAGLWSGSPPQRRSQRQPPSRLLRLCLRPR